MAKRSQKGFRKSRNSITIPHTQQYYPAVSVIVALYNAKKYITETLDSILAQTFKNYEVIIVDDCSTDGSFEIVENYISKFDGKLKLSRTEKNLGGCAIPDNKAMGLSRGEYLFYLGHDDMITPTALEELYTLAKEYDADIVYCEKKYVVNNDGTGIRINKSANPSVVNVDKPVFETNDMAERVQKILHGKYQVPEFHKFVRRSLIFEYDIFLPYVCPSEDDIFTYGLVFYAKKFLHVPNTVYIYRLSEGSIMRKKKTPQQTVSFWSNPAILGLKTLDKFMSKHEFFKQNPQYRYAVLEFFARTRINSFLQASFQLPPFAVYETIKQEFGDKLGEQDVLVAALCTLVNTQQKMFAVNQQRFNQFALQAQEQAKKFNQFAAQAQKRIAELEAQLKTK